MYELLEYVDNGGLLKTLQESTELQFDTSAFEHYMLYDLGISKQDTKKALEYLLRLIDAYKSELVTNCDDNISITIRNILTMYEN